METQARTGLLSLPAEYIHLLALNPHFSTSCSQIYHTLQDASSSFIAQYLLNLYAAYPASSLLVRAVRHPICGVEVAKEMIRVWDRRRGVIEPAKSKESPSRIDRSKRKSSAEPDGEREGPELRIQREYGVADEENKKDCNEEAKNGESQRSGGQPKVKATAPPLICPELPRRLFRSSSAGDKTVPPLLEYLYSALPSPPDANSHRGYPLCRAVLTRNIALIKFLLRHGADPGLRDGLAVEVAISGGDVEIVKLLVERDNAASTDAKDGGVGSVKSAKKRRLSLSTRLEITPRLVEAAMRSGSDKIVQYFVNEKGVMPPLQSIMKLGPVATTPVKKSQWNVKSKRQDSRHHERVKAKRKAH